MACSDFDVMMTAGAFLIHKDFLLLELQVLLFGIILAECKFLYTSFWCVKMFYFLLQSLASACLFAGFSLIVTERKILYTTFFSFWRLEFLKINQKVVVLLFEPILTECKFLYTSFFGFQRAREVPFLMERLMCLEQQKSLTPTGRNQDKKIV